MITEEKRTSNRLLVQREKELSELESRFESEKSEFKFLQQSLHPVKARRGLVAVWRLKSADSVAFVPGVPLRLLSCVVWLVAIFVCERGRGKGGGARACYF